MGKIIGKSALCFVGLVVASWLLMQFRDFNISLGNIHSIIILMFVNYILSFTLPFILTIAYTYILFRLFIREPHCYLIIALNGLFILVLHIVLLFLQVDTSVISYLDMEMAEVSAPIMALALMYKYLSGKRKPQKRLYGRAANAMFILMKSVECMCLLVVLALAGYAFMELRIPMLFIILFQGIGLLNLLTAIVYAGVVYILFRRHKHIFLIIAVNSAILLVVWGLIILKIFPVSMNYSFISFNTALLTPILTLVFRSVEKHVSAALSVNQNAPEDSITPAQ